MRGTCSCTSRSRCRPRLGKALFICSLFRRSVFVNSPSVSWVAIPLVCVYELRLYSFFSLSGIIGRRITDRICMMRATACRCLDFYNPMFACTASSPGSLLCGRPPFNQRWPQLLVSSTHPIGEGFVWCGAQRQALVADVHGPGGWSGYDHYAHPSFRVSGLHGGFPLDSDEALEACASTRREISTPMLSSYSTPLACRT